MTLETAERQGAESKNTQASEVPTRGLVKLVKAVLAVELLDVPAAAQHAAEVLHLLLAQRAVGQHDLEGCKIVCLYVCVGGVCALY